MDPNPLDATPLDDGLNNNLDAGCADFDMPVEDLLVFDLDPFPLDGIQLDGDDWVRTCFYHTPSSLPHVLLPPSNCVRYMWCDFRVFLTFQLLIVFPLLSVISALHTKSQR